MYKEYEAFSELASNSLSVSEILEDREGLDAILGMLNKAAEEDDFINTTIQIENTDGFPLTSISVYRDENDEIVFQVNDRSPHAIISKDSFNSASLRNDLRAELKSEMSEGITFNCGIMSDLIIQEMEKEQEFDNKAEEIASEDMAAHTRDNSAMTFSDEELSSIAQALEEYAYDTRNYETEYQDYSDAADENATIETVKNYDIKNMFRLEQILIGADENYEMMKISDGEYRISNRSIPAKYHVMINTHGMMQPASDVPESLKLSFDKMLNDVRSSIRMEIEKEEKDKEYKNLKIGSVSAYEISEQLESFRNSNREGDLDFTLMDKNDEFLKINLKDKGNGSLLLEFHIAEAAGGFSEFVSGMTTIDESELSDCIAGFIKKNNDIMSVPQTSEYQIYKIDSNGTKELLMDSEHNKKSYVNLRDTATFGAKIDAAIENIRVTVNNDVTPVLRAAQKGMQTTNSVRKEIIRGYSNGILSGVEVLPAFKDIAKGWKYPCSLETIKNSLSPFDAKTLSVYEKDFLETRNVNDPKFLTESQKKQFIELQKDFLKEKRPNLFAEYELGKSFGAAIYNLEKKYLLNPSPELRKEIYIARNRTVRDMELLEREALKVRIKAAKAVDELCQFKMNMKNKLVERRDIEKVQTMIGDLKESLAQFAKLVKEKAKSQMYTCRDQMLSLSNSMRVKAGAIGQIDTKLFNKAHIDERNVAEMVNDYFMKQPMNEDKFSKVFANNYFYEELEYKEKQYQKMQNVPEEKLTESDRIRKEKYERDLEQKEVVDYMAKGVNNAIRKILDKEITKEEAVEWIAKEMRNYEASYNTLNNIDGTKVYSAISEADRAAYRSVAEKIVSNDTRLNAKAFLEKENVKERATHENNRDEQTR